MADEVVLYTLGGTISMAGTLGDGKIGRAHV